MGLCSSVFLFSYLQQRAQNTVLKKAVIEEQEKTKSLQVTDLHFLEIFYAAMILNKIVKLIDRKNPECCQKELKFWPSSYMSVLSLSFRILYLWELQSLPKKVGHHIQH